MSDVKFVFDTLEPFSELRKVIPASSTFTKELKILASDGTTYRAIAHSDRELPNDDEIKKQFREMLETIVFPVL